MEKAVSIAASSAVPRRTPMVWISGCAGDGVVGGRQRQGAEAALEQGLGGAADGHVAAARAVLGSEDDHVGLLGSREPRQALARRGVDDDATRDVRLLQPAGTALEQGVRLVVAELLGIRAAVDGVTHIGERQPGAGVAQGPAEHERVAVVLGVVVGNDRVGCHPDFSPWSA